MSQENVELTREVMDGGSLRGQGASSGASFERELFIAARWREGKLTWWHTFETEAEALDAAGLRD